jgi:hypothetical protein
MEPEHTHEELRALLNAQTGKMRWQALQRHFARGVLIKVASGLDLLEVAARIVEDDRAAVERWMDEGGVAKASDEDAQDWSVRNPLLWTVVAAPWVLVQEEPLGQGPR